ncbi:diguanylate cyclase/cyclic diguanylate phosphodiesterase [Klebsiella pneumoniae]|uniref:Diguanylate cyclase/cyclic diguanylate phosphodiesterase n=1 Tax=Klebsiella pneumoniae TaxID=573 RepID=A0A2X3ED61_KLEPN|nr:diguanylate cyclase/cyclic diguanylate phosphodiesterase [Klebsiella pneumoniae]
MGARIFWGGFFAPVLLKITMYLAGQYFAFPLAITSYFGSMPLIYTVIDIQSLISAALIFTTFLYYPMRMIISPRYADVSGSRNVYRGWHRNIAPLPYIGLSRWR